jgi:hypothetical protein
VVNRFASSIASLLAPVYRGTITAYYYYMHENDREHVLQKVVAVSGFLFALLVLPVAQYLLVNGQQQAPTEQGTVAGVSTDNTVTTDAVVQDPEACIAQRSQDLADLQRFYDGEIANLNNKHNPLIQGYQAALAQTAATDTANIVSLNKLITDEQAAYSKEKAPIQAAVDKQTKEISSRSCGETPAP